MRGDFMKTTKILMMLLSLMLVFGTVLTFVSCGGTPTTTECTEHKDENGDGICDTEGCGKTVEGNTDIPADAVNGNGELFLFKDGKPTFQFVIGTDSISTQKGVVEELAETLNKLHSGEKIKVVAQGEGEPQTVEILVGTVTNRGDEYNVNKYDYGKTGYVVKQIGTKVVVTGGSDTAVTNAINHLKTTVFGIKKSNDNFTDFVIATDKQYENKQNNYSLKEITVAGTSLKEYVITYPTNDKPAEQNAKNLQTNLYDKCGIRLEILAENKANGKLKVAFRTIENTGKGDGFYVKVDADKNLIFECEYSGRSVELTTEYFTSNVFNKMNSLSFAADYNYSKNYRDIYYKNYAKGDGETDDFLALKTVHDLANENLLNVHADPDQTYYIGDTNGDFITIKTNTYFHGCKFIFDDEEVGYKSKGRTAPVFRIAPDTKGAKYTDGNTPFETLDAGATNIGWKPGKKVMLVVYQDDIRHYIRYGANASQTETVGEAQHELIIVDADGNIDPSTPVQWTYTDITRVELYFVDDRPIEVRGEGDGGEKTTVTTYHNDGPNSYLYYSRNFEITRSNVYFSGIKHVYESYVLAVDGGHGSPYTGFVQLDFCNNVIIDNFTYEAAPRYQDNETDRDKRPVSMPNATNGTMGTYEISAGVANNITWSNSDQTNFFNEDGTLGTKGTTGTNFCRNLTFDNMNVTTFDAHCGVYNGTIKNSTLSRANFIGAGTITLENVVFYADADTRSVIDLRDDYGSTWNGDVIIDGLWIKIKQITSAEQNKFNNQGGLRIFNAQHTNHFFGYTTYLPENIVLKNILVEEYTLAIENGERKEIHSAYNNYDLRLFAREINDAACDYYRDKYFGGDANKNPMVPTKKLEYYSTYTGKYAELGITTPLKLKLPAKTYTGGDTMFRDTEFWIDGVEK